jgi:hypothetical protein
MDGPLFDHVMSMVLKRGGVDPAFKQPVLPQSFEEGGFASVGGIIPHSRQRAAHNLLS